MKIKNWSGDFGPMHSQTHLPHRVVFVGEIMWTIKRRGILLPSCMVCCYTWLFEFTLHTFTIEEKH